jgi:hypothetical protein
VSSAARGRCRTAADAVVGARRAAAHPRAWGCQELVPALERLGGPPGKGIVWGCRWKRTMLCLNRSSVVYLAAINRPALGGGQEIALACDVRYAADAEPAHVADRDARRHDPGRRRQPAAPAHARHGARARAHPGMRAADGAGGAGGRAGPPARARGAARGRDAGHRRPLRAAVAGRGGRAQALPLLRRGPAVQPRAQPRARRVAGDRLDAGDVACPAAVPPRPGARRRHAVPGPSRGGGCMARGSISSGQRK